MCMDKRVLLVSAGKSFMVNAMIKNMTDEAFEVLTCGPRVNDFNKIEDRPKIVLIYMDKNVDEMMELLIYIRDILVEDDETLKLYLIGNEEEIGDAKKGIGSPEKFVSGTFLRPLNVKELCERLSGVIRDEEMAEKKKHILVVDDDGTMLRTLKLWLSDRYNVYMANSGANAITLLAKKQVDLILLDYEMPVVNGPKVLEMLRSEPSTKDTPVMFLTARNDKESVMSVMELKPEKYLLKTMPPDQLMAEIEGFFAKTDS